MRPNVWLCSSALLLCLARVAPAAEKSEPRPERAPISSERRALAAGAALVPGAVVHGTGHWIIGEPRTARRLFLLEGIGLGLVLVGGGTIVLTGASRYLVGPAAAVTVGGVGLFSTSLLADIYGVTAVDGNSARPLRTAAWIETELGYRYIYNPRFEYSSFLVERLSSRVGRFRVEPSLWSALNANNALYRIEAGYRPVGPVPRRTSAATNHVELEVAFTHHRHVPERFAISGGELSISARYDLAGLGRTLRGAFVEGGTGLAVQSIDYDLQGLSLPSDVETLLLARFGFGIVLRGASGPGSELLAYYDHRHDGYAAGLMMPGLGSGVAGHFGLLGQWFVGERFGLGVDAQVGSAYVGGASILFREGARR